MPMVLNYLGLAVGFSLAGCMLVMAWRIYKLRAEVRYLKSDKESLATGWESDVNDWKISEATAKAIEEIDANRRNALINASRIVAG